MKFPKFSGKPKRLKPILIRRVSGNSMLPSLKDGQIILVACWFNGLKVGDIVIIKRSSLETIKRVNKINNDKVYVLGDNSSASTDSREYGWLPFDYLGGRLIWPKLDDGLPHRH